MKQLAEANNIKLAFTDLSPEALLQFRSEGIIDADDKIAQSFQDVDHGLEWCEKHFLVSMGAATVLRGKTIEKRIVVVSLF